MSRPTRPFGHLASLFAAWVFCALTAWPQVGEAAAYRLMLSQRSDSGVAGTDVYTVSYDSFDALIASPPFGSPTQAFSGIDISPTYIASGLTYDGKYRLMLSQRNDSGVAGTDVYLVTYDTFGDLIASPPFGSPTQAFSSIDISPTYIASGLAYEFDGGPGTVAEPASAALLLSALAMMAGARRRTRPSPRLI